MLSWPLICLLVLGSIRNGTRGAPEAFFSFAVASLLPSGQGIMFTSKFSSVSASLTKRQSGHPSLSYNVSNFSGSGVFRFVDVPLQERTVDASTEVKTSTEWPIGTSFGNYI